MAKKPAFKTKKTTKTAPTSSKKSAASAKPAKKVTAVKSTKPAKPARAAKPAKKAEVKAVVKKATATAVAPKAKVVVKAKSSVAVQITMEGKTTKVAAPAPKMVEAPKKPEKLDFDAGDFVVYPAHGVGQVEGIETQHIAGMQVTLYTICFEKDRMRLKLPVTKAKASGLRKLSSKDRLKDALSTLEGRAQIRRIMWSRRAQEYEAKINSGDPVSIAEVLRDLRKNSGQSEQSYSERQIYQAALERLAREVAAIEQIDEQKAAEKLEAVMSNAA